MTEFQKPESTSIVDLLHGPTPVMSVEFFPPRNEEMAGQLWEAAGKLRDLGRVDFVSITYGAGGSTRERTLGIARRLREELGFLVMPHLTCVGSSREDLRGILGEYWDSGFRNIMALRGDPPKGEKEFRAVKDGFRYGGDLVELIKREYPEFCVGAGAYPEKHPEAVSPEADLEALMHKVGQGADFLTTQLFFDNELFFRFRDACAARGITCPLLPGLLPVLSLSQIRRFTEMCGSTLPVALVKRLEAAGEDAEAVRKVGVEWAHEQISGLLAGGAPGIHLYILNRSESALDLLRLVP